MVGSGNGACGFLSNYLKYAPTDAAVLVLEEGKNYFYTSDITHQNSWTKSYSEGNIFKLHNARTVDGTPILSGRACTMGGGGSINYTMIHESSKWLAKNIGYTEAYWDALKKELNAEFHRPDPAAIATSVTDHILTAGEKLHFQAPDPTQRIHNISSYKDQDEKQLYQFPTQFNSFGQRTNSGVSLVDWEDPRITLETRRVVESLKLQEDGRCTMVVAKNLEDAGWFRRASSSQEYFLSPNGGQVVLCAGAASPRILQPYREVLQNDAIGKFVNDHICLPLGIYVVNDDLKVSPKDIYGPVFGTALWKAPESGDGEDTVVCIDFFTGSLQKQLYMTSHLFLAFLPNCLKSPMLRHPLLFTIVKNVVRTLISGVDLLISLATKEDPVFITAIIKYNAAKTGQYEDGDHIALGWFEESQDKEVAKSVITDVALPLMEQLGKEPNPVIQFIFRMLTKIPFDQSQVDEYVDNYSKNSLLSEQHMAGGCLFGKVIDTGEDDQSKTGRVFGSTNVHVADLSSVPLPRVSPQMTAYLVGYHVSHQLYSSRK